MHIFIIVRLIFKINDIPFTFLLSRSFPCEHQHSFILRRTVSFTELSFVSRDYFVMHLCFTYMINDLDIRCLTFEILSNCRRQHFENFVYRVLLHVIILVRNHLPKSTPVHMSPLLVQLEQRMSLNRLNDSKSLQGQTIPPPLLPCTAVTIHEKTMLITALSRNNHLRILILRKKRNLMEILSE